MKTPLFPLLIASLCFAIVGCNKKEGSSGGDASTGTAAVTPARQTSFAEVTGQLDPGGSVYAYLATDQWLAGLSTNIARIKDFILTLPDVSAKDREGVDKVFDLLTKAVSQSGVENLTGLGVSGIQLTPELHRTKIILHHRQGQGDGLFWNLFGKEPHALAGLDLLTTNTAIAVFGDVDVPALWDAIASSLGGAGVPELSEGIQQWPAEFEKQTKLSWPKLLASLGGEVGLVLTLDDAKQIGLPVGGAGIEIPEPGLLLAVKVNDDLLFNRISSELKQNQMVEITDEKGLKMYAMPVPVPLPIELQITVASSGDYLFVATSPQLVRHALAVRTGGSGLRQSADVQALLKYLPAQGNQFTYVGRRFSETILKVQKQVLGSEKNISSSQLEFIEKLFLSQGSSYGLSIGAHTPTGWQTVSVGNQDSATAVVGAAAVFPAALLAGIAVPNFVRARETSQVNSCINNLRQIDSAKLQWALEENKNENDVPTEAEVAQYLNGKKLPTCPQGGLYTIGKCSVGPTCSQPGHALEP